MRSARRTARCLGPSSVASDVFVGALVTLAEPGLGREAARGLSLLSWDDRKNLSTGPTSTPVRQNAKAVIDPARRKLKSRLQRTPRRACRSKRWMVLSARSSSRLLASAAVCSSRCSLRSASRRLGSRLRAARDARATQFRPPQSRHRSPVREAQRHSHSFSGNQSSTPLRRRWSAINTSRRMQTDPRLSFKVSPPGAPCAGLPCTRCAGGAPGGETFPPEPDIL
jgi:hypothetical protein